MHSFEQKLHRQPVGGRIDVEDPVELVGPYERAGGDIVAPAADPGELLGLPQLGFALPKLLFRPFALRDVRDDADQSQFPAADIMEPSAREMAPELGAVLSPIAAFEV